MLCRLTEPPVNLDHPLAGVPNGEALYGTDAFRMHAYKVLTCNRRYSHDWWAGHCRHLHGPARRPAFAAAR
jgi:hypothetical protein